MFFLEEIYKHLFIEKQIDTRRNAIFNVTELAKEGQIMAKVTTIQL